MGQNEHQGFLRGDPPGTTSIGPLIVQGATEGEIVTGIDVSDRPARELGVVTGPLTDAQLRAVALAVSGPLTDAQLRASAVAVEADSAFKRLLKFEPSVGEEIRAEDIEGGDRYHGAAPDGTAQSAPDWRVVRFYRTAAGDITRVRYRTGVAWTAKTDGWGT